jgi:hypothetical protein
MKKKCNLISVFFEIWKSKEFLTISLIVFVLPLSFLSSLDSKHSGDAGL